MLIYVLQFPCPYDHICMFDTNTMSKCSNPGQDGELYFLRTNNDE